MVKKAVKTVKKAVKTVKKSNMIVLKPTYKIVNIVASSALGVELDLYKLASISQDIDYEPEQFPGAILKLHNPKSAILLFKNGKIICTGAATIANVKKSILEVVQLIKKYNK